MNSFKYIKSRVPFWVCPSAFLLYTLFSEVVTPIDLFPLNIGEWGFKNHKFEVRQDWLLEASQSNNLKQ